MLFELEVTCRVRFAIHHPQRDLGPCEMCPSLVVCPRKPVYPMIEAADFSIEVAIKRRRAPGDAVDSNLSIVGLTRIELPGGAELQIGSGDFDVHRSGEYSHNGA